LSAKADACHGFHPGMNNNEYLTHGTARVARAGAGRLHPPSARKRAYLRNRMLYPRRLSAFRLHDGDFPAIAPQAAHRIPHGQSLSHLVQRARKCSCSAQQPVKECIMHIRKETPQDAAEIRRLTDEAFRTVAYSNQKEGEIVDALRAAKALTLSLVAEEDGQVLGHVAFSPVQIGGEDKGWYGLGPVSVSPDRQG